MCRLSLVEEDNTSPCVRINLLITSTLILSKVVLLGSALVFERGFLGAVVTFIVVRAVILHVH